MDDDEMIEHEVESRTVTAELPPVMSKVVDEHSLSWLGFEEDCIITGCVEGHVRLWIRPQEDAYRSARWIGMEYQDFWASMTLG